MVLIYNTWGTVIFEQHEMAWGMLFPGKCTSAFMTWPHLAVLGHPLTSSLNRWIYRIRPATGPASGPEKQSERVGT